MLKTDTCIFSVYGISISHPKDWSIFFDPKKGFKYEYGFIRIEDYIPRYGARLSMSIEWTVLSNDTENFIVEYSKNIENQYKKQLKKMKYEFEKKELVLLDEKKALFIVSKFEARSGLFNIKKEREVKSLQVVIYENISHRVVVAGIIGTVDEIEKNEEELQALLFSVRVE